MSNSPFPPLHCFGAVTCHSSRMKAEQRPRLWYPCRGYASKIVSDFYVTEPNCSISGCADRLMNPARFDYYLLASVLDSSKIKRQLLNPIGLLAMWAHLLTHEIHWQHSPTFHLFWSRFLPLDLGHGLLTAPHHHFPFSDWAPRHLSVQKF